MLRHVPFGLLAALLLMLGGPARAAEPACGVAAAADWQPGEAWAWSEICQGRAADFAQRYGGGTDPAQAAGWPAERTVSAGFLAAILERPPWRDALTPKGVRLSGVRLDGPLDLTNAAIPIELRLEGSLVAQPLVLAGAHGASRMSFDDSRFAVTLDLGRLELAGGLTLRRAMVQDLTLSGARIGDDSDLSDLVAGGTVALDAAHIAGTLAMPRQRVGKLIDLRGARIDRDLAMDHVDLAAAR